MKRVFLFCIFFFCASYTFANIYKIHIPNYELSNGTSHLGSDSNIIPHDFGVTIEPGKPQLPCKLVWVAIPPGSEVVDCKITRESSLLNVTYYPRTSGICLSRIKEEEFYSREKSTNDESISNDIFPKKPGEYLKTIRFGNYDLAEVIIYPYTYNANTNKLYYSPNVTIEFSYANHYTPYEPMMVDTTLDSIIKDKVVNYDELKKWYTNETVSPYDYVIITPEDLLPSVKSFAEWKKSIGYKVKIITATGDKKLKYLPKYLLVIGAPITVGAEYPIEKIEGVILGRIPYTDSAIVTSILEHIIEFELAEEHKNILFVEAATAGDRSGGIKKNLKTVPYETKKDLLNLLKDVVSPYWNYSECKSEEIFNGHSIINFLSIGQGMLDNGDGIPESKEIKTSPTANFKIFSHTPFFVFAPFDAKKFLKENAVSIVCPDSFSEYMYPWEDSLSGGSQSFNYIFLKYLTDKNTVGEAFLQAKIWYKSKFPQDTLTTREFKIFGDPSLSFKKFPGIDVGIIKTPIGLLPLDTTFSPTCLVKNFGTKSLMNFEVYCTIDSSENTIYNERLFIDSLGAFEQKMIDFPKWIVDGIGVKYKFNFEVFLAYDENLSNDTFSDFSYVRKGDFIVYGDTSISSILRKLNCKGAEISSLNSFTAGAECSIYPYLSGFKSIFICDTIGLDSIGYLLQPGYNIYIEGNNTFLSKFLEGKTIQEPALRYISGSGVSFMSSKQLPKEWFVPSNCSAVFKDTTGVITGFYYEKGYKIWCNRFKISDINTELVKIEILDSIMNTFGVKTTIKGKEALELSNIIDFKSQPNPFYKKTYIKFNVRKTETKINIAVYDLSGKLVKTVTNKSFKPGKYELSWDGYNETGISVSNGIYFIKLSASGGEKETLLLKIIMLKN
ncbi:MAG: C25 family cysteine peptidase [bacterium]|nr:C25 family cysteine peptidase [bacterium]